MGFCGLIQGIIGINLFLEHTIGIALEFFFAQMGEVALAAIRSLALAPLAGR